jgi:SulP family sulfate permease
MNAWSQRLAAAAASLRAVPLLRGFADRADWRAAWTSAVIMLPQAVILATLAGLPPEAGIYASVFPVIVAALAGKCPRLLSGPNTAVAVMISAALAPLATPFSADYVKLALVLSVMVGVIQLGAAMLRLGRLFELLPPFVVQGVTLGVGIVIVSTQASAILGVMGVGGEAPWLSLWRIPDALERANWSAVAVALVTCFTGLATRDTLLAKWCPPLVAALLAGCLSGLLLDVLFGVAQVRLERVGFIALLPLPWSVPQFVWEELYLTKQLLTNALAIAFVGTLQTLIIVRNNQGGLRDTGAPNREMVAQGLANVASAFTSGFAGSGSFNRSAAHVAAGARTRAAAALSSLIMFALGFGATVLFALVPLPALAGTLVLVGIDLMRSVLRQTRQLMAIGDRANVFVVAGLTLVMGLEDALLGGLMLSAAGFVWRSRRSPIALPIALPIAPERPRQPELAQIAAENDPHGFPDSTHEEAALEERRPRRAAAWSTGESRRSVVKPAQVALCADDGAG